MTVRLAALVRTARAAGHIHVAPRPFFEKRTYQYHEVDALNLAPLGTTIKDIESDVWERKHNYPGAPENDWEIIAFHNGDDPSSNQMAHSTRAVLQGWCPVTVLEVGHG